MIFDDTEHSTLEIAMYKPFANRIFTPSCFTKDLGRKQVRYPSYHELAYLHPSRFTPNPEVLTELGLHVGEKFFVVRFVSWSAGHDIGQCGLSLADKARLVQLLAKHGRVLITAEGELPEPLKQYGISLSPGKIHDLLSFAHMYVGEGGTMATESAVLGVPSILINPLRAGNFDELVERYGLLRQCSDIEEAYAAIERLLENEGLIKVWKERRSKLLQEKVDASEFLIDEVLRGSRSAELAFLPRVVGS
jgi:predicted glycosyltransferase